MFGRTEHGRIVTKYYKDSLPGDSPETMPLDNHLFADITEGVSRNVALTFGMKDNDRHKYSLATPKKAYEPIQRTIKSGCPHKTRIMEDIERIPRTMQRIIEARGTYIADSEGLRNGTRDDARREALRDTIDSTVMARFLEGIGNMKEGKGVLFKVPIQLTELQCVPVMEDDTDDIGASQEEGHDDKEE